MQIKKVENDWVFLELRPRHIYIEYKPGTTLDLPAAKQIIYDAVQLAGDLAYPALTNIKDMPPHGKDVRDYFANEGGGDACANAILVSSKLSVIMAKFFFYFNKPRIPTRIFTDHDKAVRWLEQHPVVPRKVFV